MLANVLFLLFAAWLSGIIVMLSVGGPDESPSYAVMQAKADMRRRYAAWSNHARHRS